MSEHGRQGEQGARGVQGQQGVPGIQGIEGIGERGKKGETGERGAAGTPWRGKTVGRSFLLLTAIFTIIASFQLYEARERRQLNEEVHAIALENHNALCSFRLNLVTTANANEDLADKIESGKRPRIQGITVADIRASVKRQRNTVDSLKALDCER